MTMSVAPTRSSTVRRVRVTYVLPLSSKFSDPNIRFHNMLFILLHIPDWA